MIACFAWKTPSIAALAEPAALKLVITGSLICIPFHCELLRLIGVAFEGVADEVKGFALDREKETNESRTCT